MKHIEIKFITFLFLFSLIFQSCTTYSVLPKNIDTHAKIEGVYSNYYTNIVGTRDVTIWGLIDWKHKVETDSVNVKIETINHKFLKFTFWKNNEKIGEKLLRGKFKEDNCFYTRRRFYVIPILPILWGYENSQERIYRIDNELIIEDTYNSGGVIIIMASGSQSNNIWKFKHIEN